MHKRLLIYPLLVIITFTLFIGYGFLFGGEIPLWLIGVFIFCFVLILSAVSFKEKKDKPVASLAKYFIISVVLVFLCAFGYEEINKAGKAEVDSYKATVIDCGIHRGSYWITFKDPTGEEQTVERFDPVLLSPIYYDDEVIDYYGQKVKIIIYSGLFGFEYLVWDE